MTKLGLDFLTLFNSACTISIIFVVELLQGNRNSTGQVSKQCCLFILLLNIFLFLLHFTNAVLVRLFVLASGTRSGENAEEEGTSNHASDHAECLPSCICSSACLFLSTI